MLSEMSLRLRQVISSKKLRFEAVKLSPVPIIVSSKMEETFDVSLSMSLTKLSIIYCLHRGRPREVQKYGENSEIVILIIKINKNAKEILRILRYFLSTYLVDQWTRKWSSVEYADYNKKSCKRF